MALNEENRTLRGKGKAGNGEYGGWELKELELHARSSRFWEKWGRREASFTIICFSVLNSQILSGVSLFKLNFFFLVDITLSCLLEASIESDLQIKPLTQADTVKDDVGGILKNE